jgi:hypothetical protein
MQLPLMGMSAVSVPNRSPQLLCCRAKNRGAPGPPAAFALSNTDVMMPPAIGAGLILIERLPSGA